MLRMSQLARTTLTAALVVIAAVAAPRISDAAGSKITGTVKLKGKAPKPAPLNMKSDPFCAKHSGADETVLADAKGGLKNVVVRIAVGAQPAKGEGDVVMDQDGCMYSPRVSVALAGQTVLIKNSDQTLHNVHTYKGPATLFNQAQPQGFPPLKKTFPKPGDFVRFKCDVHPWMTGWVAVVDNPHFAVSGADGSFSIADVPPGKYTVEAWHEKFGTKTAEVEIKAGKDATLSFEFQ